MFPLPGFSDLVLIVLVVLIIFGAGKLPVIAGVAGRAILALRRKMKGVPVAEPGEDEES